VPKVRVNDITMNYEQQGTGEPLILIPYLAADNACYAFQVADYAKQFTCISIDPRGAGETDKPAGNYSTDLFADDSCRPSGWSGLISVACRSARPPDYGLPPNILNE
jgi:pimeloyl-ACP methyl ester carboxylesterase